MGCGSPLGPQRGTTDPCPAAHQPWLLRGPRGSPHHGENASAPPHSQAGCGGRRTDSRNHLWHTGPGNTEQPRIGRRSSHQSPRAQSSVHTAGRKCRHLPPQGLAGSSPREAAGRPALQLRGAQFCLFVGRRQLGFDSPICLSLVISPSGPSELSLLGGQRIWGGSFFQTKSSVKEIPENTIIALDYFLQFMTLSCPRSRSVYSTGIWTNEPAHSHTLTPTLSHTHPSLCCILGETGLRDGLWCSAIPSSGVSAALRLSLELG